MICQRCNITVVDPDQHAKDVHPGEVIGFVDAPNDPKHLNAREGERTAWDGTAAEYEMSDLLWGFVRMVKPKIVVETGTYMGHSARRMAQAIQQNGFGWLWTCDVLVNDQAISHCTDGLPATFVNCKSVDLPQLKEADLVWSDSNMDQRPLEYELVKPGCVFLMHDVWNHDDRDPYRKWAESQGMKIFPYGRGFALTIKP